VSPETLAGLRLVVEVLTLTACVSVTAALLWYLVAMRRRLGGLVGVTTFMAMFVVALALTRIGHWALVSAPQTTAVFYLEVFAAALMTTMALAVWPLVPRLVAQPTRCELLEVNRRLAEEQGARQALLEELRGLNEDLERRVAERTRELETARRRFEIALEGSSISVTQHDRDLRYSWVYNPPAALADVELLGHDASEVLPGATAEAMNADRRRVLETGVATRFEVALPVAGKELWYEGRIEPLIEDGEVVGVVTVGIDITRHRDHERAIRDMLRELTHRSKNLLAVVQGIARQSAALHHGSAETFLAPFEGRLQALSRVHEILVEESWKGVPLRRLVEGELAAAGDMQAVRIDGEDRVLTPEAAQSFALALHELVDDAASASAVPEGTTLAWGDDGGRFVFEWSRSGPPSRLSRDAYGRMLLERHLPRSVAGRVDLAVTPTRTTCRLDADPAFL